MRQVDCVRLLLHHPLHLTHRLPQAHERRAAHDGVADVQFVQAGERRDGADIGVVQGVASVEAHAQIENADSSVVQGFKLSRQGGVIKVATMLGKGEGIATGVQFADIKATCLRSVDVPRIRVNEGAGEAPCGVQRGNHLCQPPLMIGHVQATFGRDFVSTFGDQHGGVWADAAGDADHLIGRGHLQIESSADEGTQPLHVIIANVAAVFAQVNGDAIGPAQFGLVGSAHRVWLRIGQRATRTLLVSGVADGGDVIDING